MSRPHRVRYRVLSRSSFVEESLFGYVRGGSGPPRLPHAIPGPRETSPNDAGEMDLSRTPSTQVNESHMNSVCRLQRLQPSFFDESRLHSPSPPTEPSWQPPQTPLVLAPYGRPRLWSPPVIGLRRPFTADPAIAPTRVPSSMSVIGAAGSAQIASTSKTETTMKQKERRKIWRQNTESDTMVTTEQLMPELRGLKSGREATRPGSVDGRLPGSGNAKRPSWSLPSKSRTVNERPPWR